jgi:hypothetical protein
MNSDYVLVSRWPVECSRDELWGVLDDLLATDDPFSWWLSVQVTDFDGSSMRVRTASVFGYALTFTMNDLVLHRPDSLEFAATGDLRGSGQVRIDELGPRACGLLIDWRVTADRPWMRRWAWLLRPVFVAGHRLTMHQGRRHLRRWIGTHVV